MELIDTHSHIYEKESFGGEEQEIIGRLNSAGISHVVLPNCDEKSIDEVLSFEALDPSRFHALMGLHPENVDDGWRTKLDTILQKFDNRKYKGVGEVGIDLYWETKYKDQQMAAFTEQIAIAVEKELPVIIHCRNGLEETLECLEKFDREKIYGIFHSFTGTIEEAQTIKRHGDFKFGINGIVTFKKSTDLQKTVKELDLKEIVLETDSPYLTPVPFRGKRNESSYITYVAAKISELKELPIEEIAQATTGNAKEIFHL